MVAREAFNEFICVILTAFHATCKPTSLLLRRLRRLSLLLRPLLPDAHQAGLTPRLPQLPVRLLLPFHIFDLGLLHALLVHDGENTSKDRKRVLALLRAGQSVFVGVAGADAAVAAREENQAVAVGFEAGDVGVEGFG